MLLRMSKRHKSLYGMRWTVVRRRVFERDGHRCRACGKPGRLECDHVRPLQRGGDPFALSNLQTLCRWCHIQKTRKDNKVEPGPAAKRWNLLVANLLN